MRRIFKGGAEGRPIGPLKTSRDFEGNQQIVIAEVEEAILKQCTTIGVTGHLEKRKYEQEIEGMWKEFTDCRYEHEPGGLHYMIRTKYSVDCHQLAILEQRAQHEDSRIGDVKIFVDGQDCGSFWYPDSTKLASLANQAPFGRDTETVSCKRWWSIVCHVCVFVRPIGRTTGSARPAIPYAPFQYSNHIHAPARAHTHIHTHTHTHT